MEPRLSSPAGEWFPRPRSSSRSYGPSRRAATSVLPPPTHERKGPELDDILLEVAVGLLWIEHVVERVIKRAQVRIDLVLQRAGQKSQPLTRFYCGTRQDDAVDTLRQQRRNGHRHGQVGFARTRRPDAEHHVVLLDGFEIAALVDTLGLHRAAP